MSKSKAARMRDIQEAPLTLRRQPGRGRNIRKKTKYMGASATQGHSHFFWVCLYGGPWQSQATYQI